MAVLVPKIVHFIWLGNRPMHPFMETWLATWRSLNPDWHIIVWRDLTGLVSVTPDHGNGEIGPAVQSRYPGLLEKACHMSQRSNIWRYELLERWGGVYADTDVEPYKPIDGLVDGLTAFCCVRPDKTDHFECAFIGAVPHHPWTVELCSRLVERDPTVSLSMGTSYFTMVTTSNHLNNGVVVLPDHLVSFEYPNPWMLNITPPNKQPAKVGSYLRHHWSSFWFATGYESVIKAVE